MAHDRGMTHSTWRRLFGLGLGLAVARLFAPWWCGREADAWFRGDPAVVTNLSEEMIAFEANDDRARSVPHGDRFAGAWALVTHQMIALGLAQVCLAEPARKDAYAPVVTRAANKSMGPEMRRFGTQAWGYDALDRLGTSEGHAYLSYPALAVGMARRVDPAFPAAAARQHDALIAAYERRLLASPTALIETYPGEAFPTDVAAVAAAIAVHGQATGVDHRRVLAHWEANVRRVQIDKSGFVHQRMHLDGTPVDAPRGSGTAFAAYYAGFVSPALARTLTDAVFRHRGTFGGFEAIDEYADARFTGGDVDSGPVIFGVSVAATGLALGPARAHGMRDEFRGLYRTTALFGMPVGAFATRRFACGGPIGNALLLAMLTSGPELAR